MKTINLIISEKIIDYIKEEVSTKADKKEVDDKLALKQNIISSSSPFISINSDTLDFQEFSLVDKILTYDHFPESKKLNTKDKSLIGAINEINAKFNMIMSQLIKIGGE